MGTIEAASKKRATKGTVRRAVLQTVAAAGILGVALVAPNALVLLKQAGILPAKHQRHSISIARNRLLKEGFLVYRNGKVALTKKGENALSMLMLQEYKIPTPKRWDGKWRILIFDIPEHRKRTRDLVRKTLQDVGFIRLQDSVWVYPYDSEDLLILLKADFRIGKDMLYIIADSIENDGLYRKHFGLK